MLLVKKQKKKYIQPVIIAPSLEETADSTPPATKLNLRHKRRQQQVALEQFRREENLKIATENYNIQWYNEGVDEHNADIMKLFNKIIEHNAKIDSKNTIIDFENKYQGF